MLITIAPSPRREILHVQRCAKSLTQKFVKSRRMAWLAGYRAHRGGEQRCGQRSTVGFIGKTARVIGVV